MAGATRRLAEPVGRMSIVVCTPWISNVSCIWRERAKMWTRTHWWNLGVDVVYGYSDAYPLNRSQARNDAARNTDADVLFFADADMWVPEEQFDAACVRALETGCMVLAYTDHMRLNKWATERILDGQEHTYQGQTVKGCSSGAFAITRELWDRVGGNDERFLGWGYEDRAFQYSCDVLSPPGHRIAGLSYHLWHPRGKDQSRTTAERLVSRDLALRYKAASGVTSRSGIVRATKDAKADPVAMEAILREPGGPLHRVAESAHGR